MDQTLDAALGFAPDYDAADPLYAAYARLLLGDRLHDAVSLGALPDAPFTPLTKR